MMKLNKKGQEIGNLLPLFPLLILIFLLMGIFIVLAMGMSLGKSKTVPQFFSEIPEEDLMFKPISLQITGIVLPEMNIVLDAIIEDIKRERASLEKKAVEPIIHAPLVDALKKLVDNKNNLLIYAYGEAPMPSLQAESPASFDKGHPHIYLRYENGKIYEENTLTDQESRTAMRPYFEKGDMRSLSFVDKNDGKRIYIDYYYGPCRKEEGQCIR